MQKGNALEFGEDVEEGWGLYDGQCLACDLLGQVDDLGLCEECREKFERDLVRRRDWDYSAWAFGLSDEGREELNRQVIAQYGERLELIAPPEGTHRQSSARNTRRRRRRGAARTPGARTRKQSV